MMSSFSQEDFILFQPVVRVGTDQAHPTSDWDGSKLGVSEDWSISSFSLFLVLTGSLACLPGPLLRSICELPPNIFSPALWEFFFSPYADALHLVSWPLILTQFKIQQMP